MNASDIASFSHKNGDLRPVDRQMDGDMLYPYFLVDNFAWNTVYCPDNNDFYVFSVNHSLKTDKIYCIYYVLLG